MNPTGLLVPMTAHVLWSGLVYAALTADRIGDSQKFPLPTLKEVTGRESIRLAQILWLDQREHLMATQMTGMTGRALCRWLTAALTLLAFGVSTAHAYVLTELRVGLGFSETVFPNLGLGESGLLGDSFGAKELVLRGMPTTRAAVEGNLSDGTLRASASGDYVRADFDPTGFSDAVTGANARLTMGDSVTFSNVAIGQVAHLDLLVTGGFSTVPDARLVTRGAANAHASVSSADGRIRLQRSASFFADENSARGFSPDSVGSTVSYFDTLSFELLPQTYHFNWTLQLGVSGIDADFSSTARAYLRLPEGVTYTSDSGVFLATATPLSQVPLPPALYQALLGFGLLASRCCRLRTNPTRKPAGA
jgi:hypothetical protein